MSISIGSEAPDVVLFEKTAEGVRKFSLSDYRGKQNVVLLFFPAVFTNVCTTEMCTIRDTMSDYDALDAKVIGISADLPYSQQIWKDQLHLNMTLASDHNRYGMKSYGVEYNSFGGGLEGVSKRASFVIDREGILRYSEILDNANELPSFDGIKGALGMLK